MKIQHLYLILSVVALLVGCRKQSEPELEAVSIEHFFATNQPQVRSVINPSGHNPLVAEVEFTTTISYRVARRIAGKELLEYMSDYWGTKHRLSVEGLHADTKKQVDYTLTDTRSNHASVSLTMQTGSRLEQIPTMRMINRNKMQSHWHLDEVAAARIVNNNYTSCPGV